MVEVRKTVDLAAVGSDSTSGNGWHWTWAFQMAQPDFFWDCLRIYNPKDKEEVRWFRETAFRLAREGKIRVLGADGKWRRVNVY